MLTLGKIGGGDGDGRSAGYYTASVAKGRDDYYRGAGEAPGRWFGAGAAAIGLVGEVDPTDFQQVAMGAVDPRDGRTAVTSHCYYKADAPVRTRLGDGAYRMRGVVRG